MTCPVHCILCTSKQHLRLAPHHAAERLRFHVMAPLHPHVGGGR